MIGMKLCDDDSQWERHVLKHADMLAGIHQLSSTSVKSGDMQMSIATQAVNDLNSGTDSLALRCHCIAESVDPPRPV